MNTSHLWIRLDHRLILPQSRARLFAEMRGLISARPGNLNLRAIRATLGGGIASFILIFLPAWTLDYWQGWLFLGTFMVPLTLITIWMAVYDKELLERRLRGGPA